MFSASDRDDVRQRLSEERFDVVVIGGGICGAGVALDAAARGLKVALVERRDLGSGTSSKSSRQVHGGLRYLAHGEVGLVRESLGERRVLAANAPHLVTPLPMRLPLSRHPLQLRSALTLYDALGAWRYGGRHRRRNGALTYHEGRVDDARLTLTVARTAAQHGALVLTYCAVTGIDGDAVECEDGLRIRTRTIVNAAGVWADAVRALALPGAAPQLRPARGTHIVVPAERLPADVGLVLPLPGARFVFTIPWGRVTIVGTTDVDHDGPLDDPEPSEAEIGEILENVNNYVEEPIRREEIVAAYAGLRPLVARGEGRTADMSRRHTVGVDGNVVTLAGGKLTTYRLAAADAVAALAEAGLGALPPSPTRTLRLAGALASALTPLEHRYGGDARAVAALAREEELEAPLAPELPYLEAEVVWAAREELALTANDVLQRRTRLSTELPDGGESLRQRIEELLARA
jgi:glycerol-3-phosphate dehydrogenase